jgi:hypothetical protein
MKHYVVMSKSYDVNEAADAVMTDANVIAVKHDKDEAMHCIDALKQEYLDDDYVVYNSDFHEEDGGVIIQPNDEDPGYYIFIYIEEINDN